jgi:hypothetical protein
LLGDSHVLIQEHDSAENISPMQRKSVPKTDSFWQEDILLFCLTLFMFAPSDGLNLLSVDRKSLQFRVQAGCPADNALI